MAYTTINKSTDYFNTVLYTGDANSSTQRTVGFQPDFSWIKARNQAYDHRLQDSVRGGTKSLDSNTSDAEATFSTGQVFNSTGFTIGDAGLANESSTTYASWNWKANGAGSANTDGTINSTVSVNQSAGFSIVSYTGNGTSGATVGHGLGSVPKVVMVKTRSGTGNWINYHSSVGNTKYLSLNQTNSAGTTNQAWNDTSPTNQVFSLGNSSEVNGNGTTMIAYCFAEKTGYSKFGSYTGNGNADGSFIYTGFKPSFVIIKNSSNAHNWTMIDNKRLGYNDKNYILFPDLSNAEPTTSETDILSNGFKIRASANGVNQSGNTMIYMAFGQSLVGSNNVPCTAR